MLPPWPYYRKGIKIIYEIIICIISGPKIYISEQRTTVIVQETVHLVLQAVIIAIIPIPILLLLLKIVATVE